MPVDPTYYAPWEKLCDRVTTQLEEFEQRQTSSGVLLIVCAIIAMIIANTSLYEPYYELLHIKLGLFVGEWRIEYTLHHWINDGLMTLFFFVVGLEIKREVIAGDLSDIRHALLPIAAAIGGMLLPALIFYSFNGQGIEAKGWGIPMATDIAFAAGILALLSTRVPKSLMTFLVTLAIVDDLGAVTVIALFYTESIQVIYLAVALLTLGLMFVLNRLGVRQGLPYFLLFFLLWMVMQGSGIHATIAGIFAAMTIPAYARSTPECFSQEIRCILDNFDKHQTNENNLMKNPIQTSIAMNLYKSYDLSISPLQQNLTKLHAPTSYLILPLFALANAAIPINVQTFQETIQSSLALGVIFGLIFGKLFGILGGVWLVQKIGWAKFPPSINYHHIIGVGLVAGVGFTMSIFITDLAFAWDSERAIIAKTGILIASLVSGSAGYYWLRYRTHSL